MSVFHFALITDALSAKGATIRRIKWKGTDNLMCMQSRRNLRAFRTKELPQTDRLQMEAPVNIYQITWHYVTEEVFIHSLQVVWDVMPCSMVSTYQRFGEAYCHHHEGHVKRNA
jgi:hypothetical protein